MTRTKFLWALEFNAEKLMSKNSQRNKKPCTSLLSVFFPWSTVYKKECCIALKYGKWHNSELKLTKFAQGKANIIHWSSLHLQQIIVLV